MFSILKQVFIVLLSFSSSLATKCVSLNDEPCMFRPTLIDLNPTDKSDILNIHKYFMTNIK